ncbi:KpsF/GutQ family sugar-phosphate isomerase [Amphibacillus jilinensis]|uniref:KpsF/GutQ family sugar-phosphate isomerase n=1 Tax=Amphibacillus jilinensis TaxID=1216008 RepID=UPI0002E6137F|nr:SIS domain-containing protein [Amphibacillus jilinensis]
MDIIEEARRVLDIESQAVRTLASQLNHTFIKVVEVLAQTKGKVIVTGIGKSGHVGKKIAASLSSMGTPAFFVHASEGVHGDLGMVESQDIVILISNSGETKEVLALLPSLKRIGAKRIAFTSKQASALAVSCDYLLLYQYEQEADHLNLAPTTSATLALALGDALAATLSKLKEFKHADFHLYHPGGSLGEQLKEMK